MILKEAFWKDNIKREQAKKKMRSRAETRKLR